MLRLIQAYLASAGVFLLTTAGMHYASPREFPVVCGMDGVGRLEDGTRVFFGGARRPHGAMAERTVVRRVQCFSVPEELDDVTAAAFPNPGGLPRACSTAACISRLLSDVYLGSPGN
jgi:NADPH:quinone reductase-like Zn-dependent oxidoreductase